MEIYSKISKSDNILENINNKYYITPYHDYPTRPSKPKGNVNSVSEAEIFIQKMKDYEEQIENYKSQLDLYHKDLNYLYKEFHEDLKREFGTENNPKEERLYEIAYSNGHSSGFYSVYNWYSELVELIE